MGEPQQHTINATVVEEDKTRVFALDLAVRTKATQIGTNGALSTTRQMAVDVVEIAEHYLAWLKPERPQDQGVTDAEL